MSEQTTVAVTLPADVNQVDETGYGWSFLNDSAEPTRVFPGAIIVAGDSVEPFLARVVDVVDGPGDESIVHLDVLGVPTRDWFPRSSPAQPRLKVDVPDTRFRPTRRRRREDRSIEAARRSSVTGARS